MAWQKLRSLRQGILAPDGVTVGCAKSGAKAFVLKVNLGEEVVRDLKLKNGDIVDILRGTHNDRGLLKICKNGADRKLHKGKYRDGTLEFQFPAHQWKLTQHYRAMVCKHAVDGTGNLVITGPPWLRNAPDE